jgi:uncharacterized membrane protein YqhA
VADLIVAGAIMSESHKMERKQRSVAPHGKIEEAFETVLFQSRFLVLFAVLGSLIAAIMMFLKGSTEIVQTADALIPQLADFRQTSADDKLVLISVIPAIDYYLFATVLLMFSMGIYELFISEIDPKVRVDRATGTLKEKPTWLYFKTVDDLKTQIGKVIMMILIVNLFEQSFNINYSKPSDLLYLGGSLLLVAISLLTAHCLMHRYAPKENDSVKDS